MSPVDLLPGCHLLALEGVFEKGAIEAGLSAAGLSDVVVNRALATDEAGAVVLVRADRALRLTPDDRVRVVAHRALRIDPYADLRSTVAVSPLDPGRTYECRFLTRMRIKDGRRTASTLASATDDLRAMGFDVEALLALRTDMRLPDRPNASHTLWLAVLTWRGAQAYLTDEDLFEDVVPAPSNPPAPSEAETLPEDVASAGA